VPVTMEKSAPYATTTAILELIDRHRNKGLPSPVNADVLARSGISESLIPRTLQALQALDLIDEQGNRTPTLEGLRLAPEAEFRSVLSDWLRSAYADVLQFLDPSTAKESDFRDAFRKYNPIGQQPRMITLFQGLMTAAGMMTAGDRDAQPRRTRPSGSQGSRSSSSQGSSKGGGSASKKDEPDPPPPPPPKLPLAISEKALEYRLVDLMSEAAEDPEVMAAIIKVITFLKTKDVSIPSG
jgi:hypothetical protein